jgi:predicted anti-sigma-YlaC factor YlaD
MLDYLDGALDAGSRREIEAHLEECARCRTLVLEYQETWNLLGHYPPPEPSEGFVRSTVEALKANHPSVRRMWAGRAALAAAAVLLIAAVLYFGAGPSRDTGGSQRDAPLAVEPGLIENLDLIEDMDFLAEYGEDLELAMEVDLYEIISGEENM